MPPTTRLRSRNACAGLAISSSAGQGPPGDVRRLYVELNRTLNLQEWAARHAAGLVPDRWPYGFDRLAAHGFELHARHVPASAPWRIAASAVRRAAGGLDLVNAFGDRVRRRCRLAVCWDERTGVPSALRSALPGEPPTAMGALWLTEPGGDLPAAARRLAARALERCVAVWGNSATQLDILAAEWRVPRRRLHLVHMGIDVDFWHPEGEPEPALVASGGNDRHRDYRTLVEAMEQLRGRSPRLRLELATQAVDRLPEGLGTVWRELPHVEMRRLYGRAAVVVLALRPNTHMSGLSTILEAMACGRPLVVTDTLGLREYLTDGETSILVPAGDPKALAAATGELLADPGGAAELGQAARRAVQERFTTRELAARLARVFDAALADST
jgi:glycosyltransferase involved in cell wall biosynthesis